MIEEELAVLESIYCRPGEFTIHSRGNNAESNTCFTIELDLQSSSTVTKGSANSSVTTGCTNSSVTTGCTNSSVTTGCTNSSVTTGCTKPSVTTAERLSVTVSLDASYPNTTPQFSVNRCSVWEPQDIERHLAEHATALTGSSMLLELIMWLQDQIQDRTDKLSLYNSQKSGTGETGGSGNSCGTCKSDISQTGRTGVSHDSVTGLSHSSVTELSLDSVTALLHDLHAPRSTATTRLTTAAAGDVRDSDHVCVIRIDHMRRRDSYVRTLKQWAGALGVSGCVVFQDRLILLILTGQLDSIKDYIVRLRSTNIDVDSKGRPCKERMATILCPPQPFSLTSNNIGFGSFEVKELKSRRELQQFFTEHNFSSEYTTLISSLVR